MTQRCENLFRNAPGGYVGRIQIHPLELVNHADWLGFRCQPASLSYVFRRDVEKGDDDEFEGFISAEAVCDSQAAT